MAIKMRYYQRIHSETITRFNRDWAAWEYYYFEVDDDDYALKQIQKDHLGKVLKYSIDYLEDQFGGLAEVALSHLEEEYTAIAKDEFYDLWNTEFTNEFVVKNLAFDSNWRMSWYNLNLNSTEEQFKIQELIICGTYKNTFLFELGYIPMSQFYFLQINEGEIILTYSTATEWEEMATITQRWIDKLEKMAIE